MAEYGRVAYWDDRYTKDAEPFEWYQNYDGLKSELAKFVGVDDRVLVPGCGNSRLSEDIHNNETKEVVSVDCSSVVIDEMKRKYAHKAGMTFVKGDITHMEYQDGSFDVIVDKGTLDSVFCGDNAEENCEKVVFEYCRVLKPGGRCVIVSYGSPDTRLSVLQQQGLDWKVLPVVSIPKPSIRLDDPTRSKGKHSSQEVHYMYIAIKEKEKATTS